MIFLLSLFTASHFHSFFEWTGTVAFAITGALEAIRRRMDLSGAMLLAFVTGTGGGTIRDLILHQNVFWTLQPYYIYLTLLTGALVFFFYQQTTQLLRQTMAQKALLLFDALGLVAFTIDGVSKALAIHEPMVVCVMMGTLTAVGGGMMRDMLANEIPMILRGQLYATPTVLGGLAYLCMIRYTQSDALAMAACALTVLVLRLLGIYRNWHLPMIKG